MLTHLRHGDSSTSHGASPTRYPFFLRFVSLLTAISFLPASVQAWHFLPDPTPAVFAGGGQSLIWTPS